MTGQPAVVRMWTGAVRTEDSSAYIEYVERTGMGAYRTTPGQRLQAIGAAADPEGRLVANHGI